MVRNQDKRLLMAPTVFVPDTCLLARLLDSWSHRARCKVLLFCINNHNAVRYMRFVQRHRHSVKCLVAIVGSAFRAKAINTLGSKIRS